MEERGGGGEGEGREVCEGGTDAGRVGERREARSATLCRAVHRNSRGIN